MTDYNNLSPSAKTMFVVADLFGDGGKSYNASFAATILRSLTECGLQKETMIGGWVVKAIDVESILDVAAELESLCENDT